MKSSDDLADELSLRPAGSLGRTAKRGVIWTTAQSLGNRFSGALVFLVLARILEPKEFGLLATALVFVSLSSTLADAGLTRTLVQRTTLRADHLDSALLVSGSIGLVLSLAILASAPMVAAAYHEPRLGPVLMALAVLPLVTGVSGVPESILRRQLRFRALALRGTSSMILSGILGTVLAVLGYGVWALVCQVLSQALIAVVTLWASIRWRPSRRWTMEAVRELVAFGSHVLGISLLNFVTRRSPEFFIGLILGPVALGLYAVASRMLNLSLDLVGGNVQKVAFPVFSRLAQQPGRLASGYLRAVDVITTVAFPGFTLMALFGPQLTPVVFGAQWVSAGPLMRLLALMGLAQTLGYLSNGLMLATGHSALAVRWTAGRAVATAAVIGATVHLGLYPVATAMAATQWLLLPISLALVRKVSGISLRDQTATMIVPFLGCFTLCALVVPFQRLTNLPHATDLLAAAPVAVVGYLAVLLMVRRDLVAILVSVVRRRSTVPRTSSKKSEFTP